MDGQKTEGEPMTLHVIRTDVLLHALGGFEERRDYPRESKASYTDFQIRRIKKLAQCARNARGVMAHQAAVLGIPYRSLLTSVSMARRGLGYKVWGEVA